MRAINLYTESTDGIEGKKYKHHANPDISLAKLVINGQEYIIEGIHIGFSAGCVLNTPHINISIELTYVDKTLNYHNGIYYYSSIDNIAKFNYKVDNITLSPHNNITYYYDKKDYIKYPEDSQFYIEFTERGVQRLNKWFSKNY